MSTNLLIDEPPLMILPGLACKIGLNEAIILQQIHYWIGIQRKAANPQAYQNERWWIYNTYTEWQTQFPFWSTDTIYRTVRNLEQAEILISRQVEGYTKWYTIDYEVLEAVVEGPQVAVGGSAKCVAPPPQNAEAYYTETTTETTQIPVPPVGGNAMLTPEEILKKRMDIANKITAGYQHKDPEGEPDESLVPTRQRPKWSIPETQEEKDFLAACGASYYQAKQKAKVKTLLRAVVASDILRPEERYQQARKEGPLAILPRDYYNQALSDAASYHWNVWRLISKLEELDPLVRHCNRKLKEVGHDGKRRESSEGHVDGGAGAAVTPPGWE